jgi:DNA invertase Pin-like site-specific DNA recombinase
MRYNLIIAKTFLPSHIPLKNKILGEIEMEKRAKKETIKQWRVGEYLRLSKEDETAGTSLSIENQQSIIHDFIDADPLQFTLVDTYIDDGISGATAEQRPAFQQLIDDVKSGLINCVITNDTSRFARNVADAEYYVNTVFPTHDTRFIALGSPRIDSYDDPESVDGMQFHFENYFNEYYVKMTSKKIRKVFAMRTCSHSRFSNV